jgi:hypothetical protein
MVGGGGNSKVKIQKTRHRVIAIRRLAESLYRADMPPCDCFVPRNDTVSFSASNTNQQMNQ